MADEIQWKNNLSASLQCANDENKQVLVDFFSPT